MTYIQRQAWQTGWCASAMLFCALLLGSASALAEHTANDMAHLLDGRVYEGYTGMQGEDASGRDTLIFRDGRLHSVGCEEWNFSDGVLQVRQDGDVIYFETEMVSPTDGKIVWQGEVKGDRIQVNYRWSKTYLLFWTRTQDKWFRGVLQP